jgi:uncharacterized protein (AIM24 family)/uncharacterized protein YoxC
MSLYLKIISWVFGKLISILLLGVIVITVFFLLKSADQWITAQRKRTDSARERYEILVAQSNEILKHANAKYAEMKRNVDDKADELRSITDRIQELNNNRIWVASLVPGWGITRKEYTKQKDDADEEKNRKEKALVEATAQRDRQEDMVKDLESKDPNGEKISEARRLWDWERQDLENRQRLVGETKDNLSAAWLQAKPFILWGILAIVFGPILWKAFAYWIIGGIAGRIQPIKFENKNTDLTGPEISESKPALRVELRPGEELILKEDFLQGVTGDLKRKTQYFWRKSFPVLSFIAGLVMMTRIKAGKKGGKVTISAQSESFLEVCRIGLGDGETYVFRPGFMVAYIGGDAEPKISCVYRLRLQNWLTLRFRYFMVTGPGVIFLSAGRGFHKEYAEDDMVTVDRDMPALVSPGMDFGTRKAETFWSYALGKNALFDDQFSGSGLILCQQIKGYAGGRDPEKVWGRILGAIGKVFGL